MENNDAQTDARSINHSKEAAGLFKRLLRLYQHWDRAATREHNTADTQRTRLTHVAPNLGWSRIQMRRPLHLRLLGCISRKKEEKKTTKKGSPACNSQASCQTFWSVNASSEEKYLTDSQPRARNVQLGYCGGERKRERERKRSQQWTEKSILKYKSTQIKGNNSPLMQSFLDLKITRVLFF